jgi:hypothetical protein
VDDYYDWSFAQYKTVKLEPSVNSEGSASKRTPI